MIYGLEDFLKTYSAMSLRPRTDSDSVWLRGSVRINHQFEKYPAINKKVHLEIEIPKDFPSTPPIFKELDNFFPVSADYHVNPDQTLCLSSPFQLKMFLVSTPDFNEFFKNFFIPFAYAVCLKIQHNIDMVFGELSHGDDGEIEDFEEAFGVDGRFQVLGCLHALSIRKRVANKKKCLCGCGLRLGRCKLHLRLNNYRKMPRKYFQSAFNRLQMTKSENSR